MSEQPVGSASQSIYIDGEYLRRNPLWHVGESPWKAEQILRLLQRNDLAPLTICDVGCGAGEVLRQLQEKLEPQCRFYGYEISPQAFAMCQTRTNDRLYFKLADILDEDDVFVDLILILDVIEHMEDYFQFLRSIKEKSKYKIFHIPLDVSAQSVLRRTGLMKRWDMYSHLHYFTAETALRTLQTAGYTIRDYLYTPIGIDLADTFAQRMLKLPRKLGFAIRPQLTARMLGGFGLLVLAE